jgi:O-acetyl-ADP-ribose deacetylase (regulator of RNase III)
VEESVRTAFEEQKRKEALELAKLKKAGHLIPPSGPITVSPSGPGTAVADKGNNLTGASSTSSHVVHTNHIGDHTHDISSRSPSVIESLALTDTRADTVALQKERAAQAVIRKIHRMQEADELIQKAMTHQEKMHKRMLAQGYYEQRETGALRTPRPGTGHGNKVLYEPPSKG